jgi:hypothetical protein
MQQNVLRGINIDTFDHIENKHDIEGYGMDRSSGAWVVLLNDGAINRVPLPGQDL